MQTDHETHQHGSYTESKADLLARLRRIEGQVRGVQKMIDSDAYCIDVVTQLSAVIAAAEKVGLKVIEEHIRGCVSDALHTGNADDKVEELTRVLEKFLQVGRSAVTRR